ncbi:MAG TPA: PHP domain-containing protein [Vicinamibacterales bacterium]
MIWAERAGSLRRGQDLVNDLVFVIATDAPTAVLDALEASAQLGRVLHRETDRIDLTLEGAEVAVHCRAPQTAGALLLHLTGSLKHLDRLQQVAKEQRCLLDGEGLRRVDDGRRLASTEDGIYAALGLPFIPPELRNEGDEVDAARAGRLPTLVSRADIRGDLHMHTHWSDGRDSVDAMVSQALALGYEYMAITDHSPSSAASRNLSLDDVDRQADAIVSARERYPQIAILHGAEVDILPDGRLDFPDRVLQRFDIVLASLHDRAGHSPAKLMRRYEAAMTHPLVSIITHPMNRSGPERSGYDLDVDRLFELAIETGTVLEIDGAPSHLDLDATLARRAVAAGVTLSIDSDAHRTELLDRHMKLGLLTARRGWVTPANVLNIRPHAELIEFLARKRTG